MRLQLDMWVSHDVAYGQPLPRDQTPLDRRGMAILAILALLGSLHIDVFGHVGIA